MMVCGPDLSEGMNTPPVMIFINEQHEHIEKAYVLFSPVVFNLFSQVINSRIQSNCLGFQVDSHHFIGEGLQIPVHGFAPPGWRQHSLRPKVPIYEINPFSGI
jgi:hypothetical protein